MPLLFLSLSLPPTYSYLHALSSFSEVVLLYIRSGQPETLLSLSCRLSNGTQPWCPFGCHIIKDPHHLFIQCPQFDNFRDIATSSILSFSTTLLDASTLDRQLSDDPGTSLRPLFHDSDTGPAQRSLYYIGVLPAFVTAESLSGELTIHCAPVWQKTGTQPPSDSPQGSGAKPENTPVCCTPTKMNIFTASL